MEAGRELDALIAERVMGLNPVKNSNPYNMIFTRRRDWVDMDDYYYEGEDDGYHFVDEVPHYSTDIAAAWKVVEHMKADGWQCHMRGWVNSNDWQCGFVHPGGQMSWNTADTAPLAICCAALRASARGGEGIDNGT